MSQIGEYLKNTIAELLDKQGYLVELGKGRKDGGINIIASKEESQPAYRKVYGN